ncbi:dihydroorotase [Pseudoscourfieldia marina]
MHLRDGAEVLNSIVPQAAATFRRAVVMPNLVPPVTNIERAKEYNSRIRSALPANANFQPRMGLYLTDATTPDDVAEAASYDGDDVVLHGYKYYPAGATTNSDAGVQNLLAPENASTLRALEDANFPLMLHGEVTHGEVDIFDREGQFVKNVLMTLLDKYPRLRLVCEHVTTEDTLNFVLDAEKQGANVGATITPQHLLFNRCALFAGNRMRPHNFCLPILKRERHRKALLEAVASGTSKRLFLGTDSAPHPIGAKESACGCAGCYTAPHAMSLYAKAFDSTPYGVTHLRAFACENGADFYGLPRNLESDGVMTLERTPLDVPETYQFGEDTVVPLCAGETLEWSTRVE